MDRQGVAPAGGRIGEWKAGKLAGRHALYAHAQQGERETAIQPQRSTTMSRRYSLSPASLFETLWHCVLFLAKPWMRLLCAQGDASWDGM